jgi:serine/threonine protein phosphatase PrpC
MSGPSPDPIESFAEAVTTACGAMDPRERSAVGAEVRRMAAGVFEIDELPPALTRSLAAPSADGISLQDLVRARLEDGDHSEEAFAALFTVADIVDALAASSRPLVGCPGTLWRVDASDRLRSPGVRLALWRVDPGIGRLTEYQQAAGTGRIHRGLQRGLDGIDLQAASFHGFAVLLAEVLLGKTTATTAELLDSIRRLPPETAPSNLVDLLAAAIEASVKERSRMTCRELLERSLRSLKTSVFRLRPAANATLTHESFGYSVQGLHKAGGNEDRWGAWQQGPATLLVVADGVSTADLGSGSVAAEEIIQLIGTSEYGRTAFSDAVSGCVVDPGGWARRAQELLEGLLRKAHHQTVKRTNSLARERPGRSVAEHPMSSTATLAFVFGDQAIVGWVGDSPAWIYSPTRGVVSRVTAAQNLGRESDFRFEPARENASLTQTVGGCDFSPVDRKYVPASLRPEFVTVQLDVGDLLILGSDGVVDGIEAASGPDNEAKFIAEVRRQGGEKKPLNRLVRNLIAPAEEGSSHDNITLVVLRVNPGKEGHGRRDHPVARPQS